MNDAAWNSGLTKCIGVRLAGDIINEVDERGEPIVGDTLLLMLNAHWEKLDFALPAAREEHVWEAMLDTADTELPLRICRPGEKYPLLGRSLALLRTAKVQDVGQTVSPAQVDTLRRAAHRANIPSTG